MAVAPGRGLRQPKAGVANIRGEKHYLWRAVDNEGEVLESCVTKKRDKAAALKFLKKAMKRYGNPHVVVTDSCPSDRAAIKVIGNERRQGPQDGRHLNNRAENSHLPLSTMRAGVVSFPAHAKSAEFRLNPFVSAQSLQLQKSHQHPDKGQTET